MKGILSRTSKIEFQSDIASLIGTHFAFPHFSHPKYRCDQILFNLPTEKEIKNVILKAKNNALHDTVELGLIDEVNKSKTDLSCPIVPYNEMKRYPKQKENESIDRRCFATSNIDFGRINLKNFADKFNNDDIDEKSCFVEVFKNTNKRIVVKKNFIVLASKK